jgi:methyl-accepting chemotaxis protein
MSRNISYEKSTKVLFGGVFIIAFFLILLSFLFLHNSISQFNGFGKSIDYAGRLRLNSQLLLKLVTYYYQIAYLKSEAPYTLDEIKAKLDTTKKNIKYALAILKEGKEGAKSISSLRDENAEKIFERIENSYNSAFSSLEKFETRGDANILKEIEKHGQDALKGAIELTPYIAKKQEEALSNLKLSLALTLSFILFMLGGTIYWVYRKLKKAKAEEEENKKRYLAENFDKIANYIQMLANGNLTIQIKGDGADDFMLILYENLEKLRLNYLEILNELNNKIKEEEEKRRYLAENFERISNHIQLLSEGNLQVEIKGDGAGDNFMSSLYENLEKMRLSYVEILYQLKDMINVLSSATAQLSSSAEELSSGAKEQVSQTGEIASAVEEMSRTIVENAKNATSVSEIADKSANSVQIGVGTLREVINEIAKISEIVDESMKVIIELGKSSEQIGEIISVINDIADQTNLLALNAAIEAARAGEHGRGFAVVADEVRKLAEKTSKSTREIKDIINKLQNMTSTAVEAMKRSKDETERGIKLANESGKALNEIIDSFAKLKDMISQIAVASNQQASTSEQISKNVELIAKVAEETALGVNEIAKSVNDLSKISEKLNQIVSKFKVGEELANKWYTSIVSSLNEGGKDKDLKFDIEKAKTAHRMWRNRFLRFIEGKENINPSEFLSHRECQLGKWYYSEGMKNFGKVPEFIELGRKHEEFHRIGAQLIKLANEGKIEEAERKFRETDTLTNELLSLLDRLKMVVA